MLRGAGHPDRPGGGQPAQPPRPRVSYVLRARLSPPAALMRSPNQPLVRCQPKATIACPTQLPPAAGRAWGTASCFKPSTAGWAPRRRRAACCCARWASCSRCAGRCASRRAGLAPPAALVLDATGTQRRPPRSPSRPLPTLPQEPPGPGALPRFSTTAIANPQALPLLLALLRRAAPEDQLWGLAAFRELLLQVKHRASSARGCCWQRLALSCHCTTMDQRVPAAAQLVSPGCRGRATWQLQMPRPSTAC